MATEQYGKNARGDYRSLTARVPEEVKRRAKARAVFDDLDLNTLVEGLLTLYVSEQVTAEAIRAAVEGSGPPPPPETRAPATPTAPGRGGEPGVDSEGAARVRALRKRLGLSQDAFGELIGRGRRSVSEYERGQTELPPEVEARLDELERGLEEGE